MALPQRQSHIVKQKTGPDDPILEETLQEALKQVSPQDVIAIADELAQRHAMLFLGVEADSARLASSFSDIAAAVTHTRANARIITNYFAEGDLSMFEELLHGESPTPLRVATFVEKLSALDTRLGLELASGFLHNTSPNA
ncbi:MAG TPA: hypothetical protein VK206_09605, partial [Anaerolineales bacterium]|nr:hypothetical protein [Anaerolineales bacterium]